MTTQISTANRAKDGKYLTFRMGEETYGVEVIKVREIIRMQLITPVPQMPPYIKGVINLRGKIIPILDLRLRFGLPEAAPTEATCIVVVQGDQADVAHSQTGLIVDGVDEVLNISANDIENTPNFGTSIDVEAILGMAKIKGAVKTLIDINCVIRTGSHPIG